MGSKVAQYAALIVAENPVELHKEFRELEEEAAQQNMEFEKLQAVTVHSAVDEKLAADMQGIEEELRLLNISRY